MACRDLEVAILEMAKKCFGETVVDPSRSKPGLTDEEKKLMKKLKRLSKKGRTKKAKEERLKLRKKLTKKVKEKAYSKFCEDLEIAIMQETKKRDPTAIWRWSKKVNRQESKLRIPYYLKTREDGGTERIYGAENIMPYWVKDWSKIFNIPKKDRSTYGNKRKLKDDVLKYTREKFTLNITKNKIMLQRSRMINGKAKGPLDKLPPELIKYAAPIYKVGKIDEVLLWMFKTCVHLRTIPDYWSVGRLAVLYKDGEVGDPMNYRLIAILAMFGRVWSKYVANELTTYLTNTRQNVMNDRQCGYCPQKMTSINLVAAADTGEIITGIPKETVDNMKAEKTDKFKWRWCGWSDDMKEEEPLEPKVE